MRCGTLPAQWLLRGCGSSGLGSLPGHSQHQEVICEFGDSSCPFGDSDQSRSLVLVSSPSPKPGRAAKRFHCPSSLLPSPSSQWRQEMLAPIWFPLASSDPSKYLPCSAEAAVWLTVPKCSCWLQSPDVFLCLHFPLSRLFSNTHGIRVWGRQDDVLGLPQTSIFQQKGWGLSMPDSPVGCRGDFLSEFALPVSLDRYLKLSTKFSLITVTNGFWEPGGCFGKDRA